MIQDQQQATPEKPFFLYFATGATHAPHQAPAAWIERYRGRFDDGWEAWRDARLRPPAAQGHGAAGHHAQRAAGWMPAWSSLPRRRASVCPPA